MTRRGRATGAVALTLVTSAAAHVDGGGALPDLSATIPTLTGALVLALGCLAVGLLAAGAHHRHPLLDAAKLLPALAIGQVVGHLGYGMGAQHPSVMPYADATTTHPMAGMDHSSHAATQTFFDADALTRSGLGTGSPVTPPTSHLAHLLHMGPSMLLAHTTAVLVGLALLLACERLGRRALDWFRRVVAVVVAALPPSHPAPRHLEPRQPHQGWLFTRAHPRRGPPLTA